MGKKDRWQHNFDRDFFLKRFFLLWSENKDIELHKKGICSNITGVTPPKI